MGRFHMEERMHYDSNYRFEVADKVCDILNEFLPEDQKIRPKDIITVADQKTLDKYERTAEFRDKMEKEHFNVPGYKAEPGPKREVQHFMGTPEEKLELAKKVCDPINAKKYIYDNIVNDMEMNIGDELTLDEDLMVEKYMENNFKYDSMFARTSLVQNQKLSLTGSMNKAFENQKGFVEAIGSNYQQSFEKQSNPFSMIIPDLPQISADLIQKAIPKLVELGNKEPYMPSILKNPTLMISYGLALDVLHQNKSIMKDMSNSKEPPKNIMSTKFLVEGKEVSYNEYLNAASENKPREIVSRTKGEVSNIKDSLYSGKCLSYSKKDKEKAILAGEIRMLSEKEKAGKINTIFDRIESFSKNVNKTNSVFSKDTDEFKKMRDLANKFVKECKDANISLDDAKGINEYFKNKKEVLDELKAAVNDYVKKKDEKNLAELNSGKKLSNRSIERTKEAKEMAAFFETCFNPNELEYKELPQEPYRDTRITEKVVNEIKESEKQNEKIMVQELSKTKEMEMEMSGLDNN